MTACELETAARKLREVAAKATRGPWTASPVWSTRSHATSAVYSRAEHAGTAASEVVASGLTERAGGIGNPHNAVWIALAHPGLAEPLAAWLEQVAQGYDVLVAHGRGEDAALIYTDALAVARVINGSAAVTSCCDLHNIHCEPPADLCCMACTEANHPNHPTGVRCVLNGSEP